MKQHVEKNTRFGADRFEKVMLKGVCHEIFDNFFLSCIRSFLGPDCMEEKFFEFFRKLVEIFAIFGASPVSTTPVKQKKI